MFRGTIFEYLIVLLLIASIIYFAKIGKKERLKEARLNEAAKIYEMNKNKLYKTYSGKQKIAEEEFLRDQIIMANKGFHEIGRSYEIGQWSGKAFFILIAISIVIMLISLPFGGVVLLCGVFYMLIVKPAGVLTVKFERRAEEKTCPQCAERLKPEALICRFCGYRFE